MAEDQDDSQKTEEPTQKRLDDARKKGDVPKSTEASGFLLLAAGAAAFAALGPGGAAGVSGRLEAWLAGIGTRALDPGGARAALMDALGVAVWALAAPLAVFVVVAIVGHVGQTGFIVSAERMKPKLNKINPLSGLKRMFGAQGAANFVKGIAKLTVVGAAGFVAVWPRRNALEALVELDAMALLSLVYQLVLTLLAAALAAYAAIAGFDYVGQRMSWMKRQRMSRHDVKEEHKQAEGDPHVKARLRQIRQERSRRRMIAAVPDATVVVTNPTHYAIALRYVQGETPAPVCLAKGVDAVALKIREAAEAHNVPIYEEPPLARALWATAELDREIPREHYAAVAKIIGYVLSLAQTRRKGPSAIR